MQNHLTFLCKGLGKINPFNLYFSIILVIMYFLIKIGYWEGIWNFHC